MSIHFLRRSGASSVRRQLLAGIAGTLLLGAAPLALAASPGVPAGLNPPAKPTAMPAFELPTLAGQTLRSETLKGQVLVIRFWASWWTICRGEMPSVQRAHDTFKAGGVTVLAVSIDGSGAQGARPVIDEGKFSFTVPIDQSMTVARQFGVRGVPTTFVVDRKGSILAQGFGPIDFDSEEFRGYVKAVAARP